MHTTNTSTSCSLSPPRSSRNIPPPEHRTQAIARTRSDVWLSIEPLQHYGELADVPTSVGMTCEVCSHVSLLYIHDSRHIITFYGARMPSGSSTPPKSRVVKVGDSAASSSCRAAIFSRPTVTAVVSVPSAHMRSSARPVLEGEPMFSSGESRIPDTSIEDHRIPRAWNVHPIVYRKLRASL